MKDKELGSIQTGPTDRSTDGSHGPRDTAEQSTENTTRGCSGSAPSSDEFTPSEHYKGRGPGVEQDRIVAVIDRLRERMAGEHSALIDSEDLAGEPVTHRDAGAAMSWLARRGLLEFEIERWTGANTTPAVWSVERKALADGGETAGTAPAIPDVTGDLVDGDGQAIAELDADVALPAAPTFDVVKSIRALSKFEERVGGPVNIGLVENQSHHEAPVLALWSVEQPHRAILVAPCVSRSGIVSGDGPPTAHTATDGGDREARITDTDRHIQPGDAGDDSRDPPTGSPRQRLAEVQKQARIVAQDLEAAGDLQHAADAADIQRRALELSDDLDTDGESA